MKIPFEKEQTPKNPPSQERKPTTPPAVRELTDTDLEHVQGEIIVVGRRGGGGFCRS